MPESAGAALRRLTDRFQTAANECSPLDVLLIELTDPPALRSLPVHQWPPALISHMTGGRGYQDCGSVVSNDAQFNLILCGDDGAQARFAEVTGEAAELLKGRDRNVLPHWLGPLPRWLHGMAWVYARYPHSPHALRAKLALHRPGGRPEVYVGDFDPTAGSIPARARAQGFLALHQRVYYHKLNDLWGASIAFLTWQLAGQAAPSAEDAGPAGDHAAESGPAGNTGADNDPNAKRKEMPTVAGPFGGLRAAAEQLRLKGNEATIVTTLCANDGRVPVKDLAVKMGWEPPYTPWNPARVRLNRKLKKHGWRIETHDGQAVAKLIETSARK
jgi:hypothetical protein